MIISPFIILHFNYVYTDNQPHFILSTVLDLFLTWKQHTHTGIHLRTHTCTYAHTKYMRTHISVAHTLILLIISVYTSAYKILLHTHIRTRVLSTHRHSHVLTLKQKHSSSPVRAYAHTNTKSKTVCKK